MNLDKLLELAEAARGRGIAWFTAGALYERHPDDAAYIAAASPEVVAALVRVAQAAQAAVQASDDDTIGMGTGETERTMDALRAALAEVTR